MSLTLKPEEQELLREEVAAFLAAAPNEQAHAECAALLATVEAGEVPDDALGALGEVLEIGLQTGRIRKIHRALGEQTLLRLFHKTPAGAAHTQGVNDLNAALAQLEGQQIESVRVLARVPGTYLVMISTDDVELTLRFSPDEAAVESVGVGV
jgi:hypothetical protein